MHTYRKMFFMCNSSWVDLWCLSFWRRYTCRYAQFRRLFECQWDVKWLEIEMRCELEMCRCLSYLAVLSDRGGTAPLCPGLVLNRRCFFPSKVIFSEMTLFYAPFEILAVNLKGSRLGQPVCWVGCGMDGRIFWFRFSQGSRKSSFLQTVHTSHPSSFLFSG